jgi:hypothetical protein
VRAEQGAGGAGGGDSEVERVHFLESDNGVKPKA